MTIHLVAEAALGGSAAFSAHSDGLTRIIDLFGGLDILSPDLATHTSSWQLSKQPRSAKYALPSHSDPTFAVVLPSLVLNPFRYAISLWCCWGLNSTQSRFVANCRLRFVDAYRPRATLCLSPSNTTLETGAGVYTVLMTFWHLSIYSYLSP